MTKLGVTALLVLLTFSNTSAAEIVWGFKNPAFHYGNGYSTHVLSVEQLQFNRKKEIADFKESAHPALKTPIAKILDIILHCIDEHGDLDEDLTRELILEKHSNNIRWKHFGEELKNLDI